MRSVMPPLNALRAFEAIAQHLSMTEAAKELNVTPGALSHQIRALEELAGEPAHGGRAGIRSQPCSTGDRQAAFHKKVRPIPEPAGQAQ